MFLLGTGTKLLAEASLRDTTYGIGMSITYGTVLDKKTWKGRNKLGECLMKIRSILNEE